MSVDPVRFIVHMEARSGKGEELRSMLESMVDEIKMEEGCFDAHLLRDIRRSDQFAMLEDWISVEARDSFMEALQEAGVMEVLDEYLTGRPDTRAFMTLI